MKKQNEDRQLTISISHKTIYFTLAVIALTFIMLNILDILMLFFFATIIMSAISPIAEKAQEKNIPRGVAVVTVFVSFFTIVGLLIFLVINPFLSQISELSERLTNVGDTIMSLPFIDNSFIEELNFRRQIANISNQIVGFIVGLAQNIFAFVTVFFLSIYLSLEKPKIMSFLDRVFTSKKTRQTVFPEVEHKLGYWLRSQILLSIIVGVLYYIALKILDVDFALSLAILGGIFEFIPFIGPFLAAIPAILVGFTISPLTALLVAVAYFIVQQIESNIIIPKLMQQAVGVNPVLIIVAITIAGKLLGIIGVFLAVPLTAVIQILVNEYWLEEKPKGS